MSSYQYVLFNENNENLDLLLSVLLNAHKNDEILKNYRINSYIYDILKYEEGM